MGYFVTDEPCRAILPVSRALAIPSLSIPYDGGSSSACWTSKKQFQHQRSSSSSTDPDASCRGAPTGFRHAKHAPPSRSAASSSDSSVIVSSAGPTGVVTKLRTPHMVPQELGIAHAYPKESRKRSFCPPTCRARHSRSSLPPAGTRQVLVDAALVVLVQPRPAAPTDGAEASPVARPPSVSFSWK